MPQRHFAIILEASDWFEAALSGRIDTAHSPPNMRPNMKYLEEGDPVLVFTIRERKFAGELRFKEAREVKHDEFVANYRIRAFVTKNAHFPSTGDNCWIMVFDEVTEYQNKISEEDMQVFHDFRRIRFIFHRRGFQLLTEKYWDSVRERIRKLGQVERIIRPRIGN